MANLNEPIVIGNIKIRNRIAMAAVTCFPFENEGGYMPQYKDHYTARARGGAGLIITSAVAVAPQNRYCGIWEDGQTEQIRDFAKGCREQGARMIVQLIRDLRDVSPLSTCEIQSIQKEYIDAVRRVHAAGADGVEIYACHAKSLCNLLNAGKNNREDQYGGSTENRARFITEMIPAIREITGENFIICIRLGGNMPTFEEGVRLAKILEKAGADILNITWGEEIDGDVEKTMNEYAVRMKKEISLPVMAAGNIFTKEDAERLMEVVDMVAVGRALMADENWSNKVLTGQEINPCLKCPRCGWFSKDGTCPAQLCIG